MSDNSGSGAFGKPFLNGYTTTWDVTVGKWVATSDTYGTVLHGRDQGELDEALGAHVVKLADELYQVLASATWHGYPLPQTPAPGPPSAGRAG